MTKPSKFSIRQAQAPDFESLRQLILETIDGSYTGVYPPRAVDFFKEFHTSGGLTERNQQGTIFLVEEKGKPIATGSLLENEILAVFVHPGCQGAGLGKMIMEALEDKAKDNRIEELSLSVSLPSKAFYEGLGYEIIEERQRDLGNGEQLVFWKARKALI